MFRNGLETSSFFKKIRPGISDCIVLHQWFLRLSINIKTRYCSWQDEIFITFINVIISRMIFIKLCMFTIYLIFITFIWKQLKIQNIAKISHSIICLGSTTMKFSVKTNLPVLSLFFFVKSILHFFAMFFRETVTSIFLIICTYHSSINFYFKCFLRKVYFRKGG